MKKVINVILIGFVFMFCVGCATTVIDLWQEQYDLGVRYLSEGNYEEAIIAFTTAINIDPKNADSYIGLAQVYVKQEEYELAIETLNTALNNCDDNESLDEHIEETKEKHSDWMFEQGQKQLSSGNYEQAIELFNNMIEEYKTNVKAYISLADIYIELEDYEGALKVLQSGYEITQNLGIFSKIEEIKEMILPLTQKTISIEDAINYKKEVIDILPEIGSNFEPHSIRIPKIVGDSITLQKLNKEIYDTYSPFYFALLNNEEGSAIIRFDYDYKMHNGVLGMVVYLSVAYQYSEVTSRYDFYYYDMNNDKQLDFNGYIEAIGIDEDKIFDLLLKNPEYKQHCEYDLPVPEVVHDLKNAIIDSDSAVLAIGCNAMEYNDTSIFNINEVDLNELF